MTDREFILIRSIRNREQMRMQPMTAPYTILTVYIVNAEDGSGLEAAAAVLHPLNGRDKFAGVEFRKSI